jgi:Condensation domain
MTTMTALRLPSSYYQRDWVLACRDATSHFSTPLAWRFAGPIDPEALVRALAELARRHDALRTSFRARHDEVDQLVWPNVDVPFELVDAGSESDVDIRIIAESGRPRALEVAPLWHAILFRIGPQEHVLALFIHHLVFDGWSHGVLHDELVRCYRAAVEGRAPRLPTLSVHMGDFAHWQRGRCEAETEDWWRERLRDLPPLSALPVPGGRFITRPVPAVRPGTTATLRALTDAHGTGLTVGLLTAVVFARRRVVGDDVVIGVTRAGRERPALQRVVGPLLDHVPVRVDASGPPNLRELMLRVHRSYQNATARVLPLGRIRQVVPDELTGRGGRLFDTRYNYLPATAATVAIAGEVTIAARPIDPVRLTPRHTEDHPEVLPLSYILYRPPDGEVTGAVCGHDGIHSGDSLDRVAAELAETLELLATDGSDRP